MKLHKNSQSPWLLNFDPLPPSSAGWKCHFRWAEPQHRSLPPTSSQLEACSVLPGRAASQDFSWGPRLPKQRLSSGRVQLTDGHSVLPSPRQWDGVPVHGILRDTGDPINRPHPDSFIRQSSHARRCKLERPEATASPLSTEQPTPKAQMTLREKRAIVPAPSFRALAQRSCPRRETDYKRKTSETCLERTKFTCNTAWRLVDSSELGGEP